MNFEYRPLPWNIDFGPGAVTRLPERLDALGFERPLILSTPGRAPQARRLAAMLSPLKVGVFDEAATHTPLDTVRAALRAAKAHAADCSVAIGGGSTIGLGKVLMLEAEVANIAVPTTYSGSEMTNIWGYSDAGKKKIGRDNRIVPNLTIYDPELTLDLPPDFSAASGCNALAQAIVNVTVNDPNPLLELWALEAIRCLAASLRVVVERPRDLDARGRALYGAMLAGGVIGLGTTSLHHKLCHVLGGAFGTPHALTHALLLPYTVAFNEPAVPEGTRRVAAALGVDAAASGLLEFARSVGIVETLADLNLRLDDLDEAARLATDSPLDNPRAVDFENVRALLHNAFFGAAPSSGDD